VGVTNSPPGSKNAFLPSRQKKKGKAIPQKVPYHHLDRRRRRWKKGQEERKHKAAPPEPSAKAKKMSYLFQKKRKTFREREPFPDWGKGTAWKWRQIGHGRKEASLVIGGKHEKEGVIASDGLGPKEKTDVVLQ